MAYSTVGDLIAAMDENTLRALADRNGDDVPDTNVINAGIAWADSRIDSKLSSRYSVPLYASASLVSDVVRNMSIDLCKWRLLNGTIQPEVFGEGIREAWKNDYDEVMDTLSAAATGTLQLKDLTRTGVKPEISTGNAGSDVEKTFTLSRQNVGGGVIDTDEAGTMDTW